MLVLSKCQVCGLYGCQNSSGLVQVGLRERVVSTLFCRKESVMIVWHGDKRAFQARDDCLGGPNVKKLDDKQVYSVGGKNIPPCDGSYVIRIK